MIRKYIQDINESEDIQTKIKFAKLVFQETRNTTEIMDLKGLYLNLFRDTLENQKTPPQFEKNFIYKFRRINLKIMESFTTHLYQKLKKLNKKIDDKQIAQILNFLFSICFQVINQDNEKNSILSFKIMKIIFRFTQINPSKHKEFLNLYKTIIKSFSDKKTLSVLINQQNDNELTRKGTQSFVIFNEMSMFLFSSTSSLISEKNPKNEINNPLLNKILLLQVPESSILTNPHFYFQFVNSRSIIFSLLFKESPENKRTLKPIIKQAFLFLRNSPTESVLERKNAFLFLQKWLSLDPDSIHLYVQDLIDTYYLLNKSYVFHQLFGIRINRSLYHLIQISLNRISNISFTKILNWIADNFNTTNFSIDSSQIFLFKIYDLFDKFFLTITSENVQNSLESLFKIFYSLWNKFTNLIFMTKKLFSLNPPQANIYKDSQNSNYHQQINFEETQKKSFLIIKNLVQQLLQTLKSLLSLMRRIMKTFPENIKFISDKPDYSSWFISNYIEENHNNTINNDSNNNNNNDSNNDNNNKMEIETSENIPSKNNHKIQIHNNINSNPIIESTFKINNFHSALQGIFPFFILDGHLELTKTGFLLMNKIFRKSLKFLIHFFEVETHFKPTSYSNSDWISSENIIEFISSFFLEFGKKSFYILFKNNLQFIAENAEKHPSLIKLVKIFLDFPNFHVFLIEIILSFVLDSVTQTKNQSENLKYSCFLFEQILETKFNTITSTTITITITTKSKSKSKSKSKIKIKIKIKNQNQNQNQNQKSKSKIILVKIKIN
ncbi:hypothetical protein M0811_14011 [Anaeramoeba ignava]|uniref:Uncharacterized protein n=1 Tax=Anaeramoeba ignava TaxID=1746090 RepID=A0A9Q0LXS0_ANAIG|nr:hypothetical protein M0811_14011 [Anaeramoeba ignava]